MSYVCHQLADRPNIYGEFACKVWVAQPDIVGPPSTLDSLAITKDQAYQLASAVCLILILAYCYKLVERNFL